VIAINTEFFCGEVGCAALGMAFIAAMLTLFTLGYGIYLWRRWLYEKYQRPLQDIDADVKRLEDPTVEQDVVLFTKSLVRQKLVRDPLVHWEVDEQSQDRLKFGEDM
jgi:hypothetical protein